jgi:hypothetical protein
MTGKYAIRTSRIFWQLVVILLMAVGAKGECVGSFASAFGAKGDAITDDTAAIQAAINAAAKSGGGSVVLKPGRYLTGGRLTVPRGVVLCGAVEGPFDVVGVNPASQTIAPTLLVTNRGGPFLTLQGIGAGVTDILFHYPNQVLPTAAIPIVFPYTIRVIQPGTKVARCTVTNAYQFLDIEVGRTMAQDLFIGAFNTGINIDHALDHVTLRNIIHTVFWDVLASIPYPAPIDAWVLRNGSAFVVNRADSLEIHDVLVFSRFAGFLLRDSPDASQNPRSGYGTASDIDLDTVQFGILASATNDPGFKFTNIDIGAAPGIGKGAVLLQGGGANPPAILINGGSVRGNWLNGPFPAPASGRITIVHVIGFDIG